MNTSLMVKLRHIDNLGWMNFTNPAAIQRTAGQDGGVSNLDLTVANEVEATSLASRTSRISVFSDRRHVFHE